MRHDTRQTTMPMRLFAQVAMALLLLLVAPLATWGTPRQPGSQPAPSPQRVYTTNDMAVFPQLTGQTIVVRGLVAEFRASWTERAPNIIYLRNGENEIEIVYWTTSNVPVALPNFSQPGTQVFAEGVVEWYRGRLQIRVDDLTRLSTSPLPPRVVAVGNGGGAAQDRSADGQAPARQMPRWEPFSALRLQEELDNRGHVVIYVRASDNPRSREVDTVYMLHPDAARLLGDRPLLFVNADNDQGLRNARDLNVMRIPTVLLMNRDGEVRRITFDQNTTPRDVYEFMSQLP